MHRIRRGVAVFSGAALAATAAVVGLLGAPVHAATWNLSDLNTSGVDATRLAQELAGQGVTISDVTFTGENTAAGLFAGVGVADTIGITDGVVLSSGEIADVVGPNDDTGKSGSHGRPGDDDLDDLVNGSTRDAAILEFKFIPVEPDVEINYVFASEEYKEFVDSSFNDVFGFFVNGQNCATVDGPAGPEPVSINTINHKKNAQIYIDNPRSSNDDGTESSPFDTQFDGFTQVLTCAATVTPGVENTMKLAIADRTDTILDSAVFLESNGITSTPKTRYAPLGPTRIYDSRDSGAKVAGGTSVTIPVAGLHGVPADAVSVALNVTAAEPDEAGFLAVYPATEAVPATSNVNYFPDPANPSLTAIPNLVVAKIGTDGAIKVYSSANSNVIVDLFGYFSVSAEDGFVATASPTRVVDTRNTGKPGPGGIVTFDVAAAGVPASASAVVLNLTVTEPDGPGFLAAYPAGAATPATSNVNYQAGETRPNAVIVPIGASGQVSVLTHASAHVIADVFGYYAPGSESQLFKPVKPKRIWDTRANGEQIPIPAGGSIDLKVTDILGVPSTATAVVLNVTVTEPQTPGFLTVYPRGLPQPGTSNVNYVEAQTVPNVVITGVSADGWVTVYSLAQAHVVVDVAGWFG